MIWVGTLRDAAVSRLTRDVHVLLEGARAGYRAVPAAFGFEPEVVVGYVFADEFPVPARPGPAARTSDAELVALAVCQAAMGICSDRRFLGLVGWRLPSWFPSLPG